MPGRRRHTSPIIVLISLCPFLSEQKLFGLRPGAIGIVSSDPPDGAIDARAPYILESPDVRVGWESVSLSFNGGMGSIAPGDFEVAVTSGPAPIISSVSPSGNTALLVLNQPIPLGVWTVVTHLPSGTSVRLAHLPGDVNGDGYVGGNDTLALVDQINEAADPLPEWSCDMDRSGTVDALDVATHTSLLQGTGLSESWYGRSLPGATVGTSSTTRAGSGAVIELRPATIGPYPAGGSLVVDVWIHNQESQDIYPRLVQFNTNDTDTQLVLPSALLFDFSSLTKPGLYATFPGFPTPVTAYVGTSPIPGQILRVPGNGSLHIGKIAPLGLPLTPGTYLLDVMNADESNINVGALIIFGFGLTPDDPITEWRASTGELIGGMLAIEVLRCQLDSDCDDGNPCTDSLCVSEVCQHNPDDTNDPEDGLFCNGEESCLNGAIIYTSPPPDCDDDESCTLDSCDESLDRCVNEIFYLLCLIDEACYSGGDGNPANECEHCDPAISQTDWSPRPAGAACGNPIGSDCDNPDACDAQGACQPNHQIDGTLCEDGGNECSVNVCTQGACTHSLAPLGTPCGSQNALICDEPDTCDGAGICQDNLNPNGTLCLDEDFCNGIEVCFNGSCQAGSPVDCGDGEFCNGIETCDPIMGCISGTPPCPQPGSCNGETDTCTEPIPTLSTSGLICLTFILLVVARVLFYRFESRPAN